MRIGWIALVGVASASALAASFGLGGGGDTSAAAGRDELAGLRAELVAERSAREDLAAQVLRLEADLAALRSAEDLGAPPDAPPAGAGDAEAGAVPGTPAADVADVGDEAPPPGHGWFDASRLAAAGLSERDAADLRRLFEETELQRLYLRDQATRERWPNGRLVQELAALDQRLTSVRDDYGDGAYDWFLYAAGRTNRVAVESVLPGSAADELGLRPGDLVYAYGGERVFKPWSLVQSTQSGRLGETVELEVQRGGERLQLTVPRGPLGVRIGRAAVEPPPVR